MAPGAVPLRNPRGTVVGRCCRGALLSGPAKGVITKGVFSPEKSLESLNSLNSLESLGNGRNLLSFPLH